MTLVKTPPPTRKKIMVGPGQHTTLHKNGASVKKPETKLGQLAQQLADQTQAATLSVAAITGYVYALNNASSPAITFTDVPPGMTSSLKQFKEAYNNFQTSFAAYQGQAEAWVSTGSEAGTTSLLTTLVSIPNTLNLLKSSVKTDFTLIKALQKSNPLYKTKLDDLKALIGAESGSITTLVSSLKSLGTNLQTSGEALVTDAKTGILKELLNAYGTDISTLKANVTSANQTISSDNHKIAGEGVGAGVSVGVALVGLVNYWNPVGWVMLGAGIGGAYAAISEIGKLKAQIAQLKLDISSDIDWESKDQKAAGILAGFINQVEGFSTLNDAAQKELTALEAVFTTLGDDIAAAVADLKDNEIDKAQTEWENALSSTGSIDTVGAYLWPSTTQLTSASSYVGISDDIYAIDISGEMYHYTSGAWSKMNEKSLSVEGEATTLVAIDGAPLDGSKVTSTPNNSSYVVKSYDMSSSSWSKISTFPAADIAVGGTDIYAINQEVSDRQVHKYSGSGTTWNALTAMPGSDAAFQIAVAAGNLFAIANNSQNLYQYDASGSSWTQVDTFTCTSIEANGNYLAIVDTDNNAYYLDASTAGATPTKTVSTISVIGQRNDGNQYVVGSGNLDLNYVDTSGTNTNLENDGVIVFVSDTNKAYYTASSGTIYSIDSSGTKTALPAMNASS